ncbi:MAG: peptide ABC transporter substrate-binding protein [Aliidongia sp.]
MAFAVLALFWVIAPATAAVLHRYSLDEPDTLDPQKSVLDASIAIAGDLFAGLVTLSEQGRPVPGIATHWEMSDDGLVWTFHLRPDAHWSNGEPVTAEDFVYSFRRLVDPRTAAADTSALDHVVNAKEITAGRERDLTKLGVEAPDPLTLRLHLIEPQPILLLHMTDNYVLPLHRATLEKWGNDWTKPEHLVGNGPFVLKSWTPQSAIVLAKNQTFFDAATVRLDEVHWLIAPDDAASLRRYQAGELDLARLDRIGLSWAHENRPAEVRTAPAFGILYMFFNMTRGPWATDRRIREALNLALDRDALVTKVDQRGEPAAYGLVPVAISNYMAQSYDWRDQSAADRLARAKALLAEAGYGRDHHLALTVSYPTDETFRHLALAVRSMWQPLGVDLDLKNSEGQVWIQAMESRDYDIGFAAQNFPYDDAEPFLDVFRSDAHALNLQSYANAEFDAVLHRASTALDPAVRRELLEAAERTALADYPAVPLEMLVRNAVVSPKLLGIDMRVPYSPSRYMHFEE